MPVPDHAIDVTDTSQGRHMVLIPRDIGRYAIAAIPRGAWVTTQVNWLWLQIYTSFEDDRMLRLGHGKTLFSDSSSSFSGDRCLTPAALPYETLLSSATTLHGAQTCKDQDQNVDCPFEATATINSVITFSTTNQP